MPATTTAVRLLRLLLPLLLTAGAAAAQAGFTAYGRGCALPGSPPPLIRFSGLPQPGATYSVSHVALPNGITPVSIDLPALITGLQQTATPMPLLSSLQPAGCLLLTDAAVLEIMPQIGPSGFQASVNWTVPNNAALIGLSYHHQWLSLYSRCSGSACTPMMIRATDAATAQIGP